jgi:hypothetical protein
METRCWIFGGSYTDKNKTRAPALSLLSTLFEGQSHQIVSFHFGKVSNSQIANSRGDHLVSPTDEVRAKGGRGREEISQMTNKQPLLPPLSALENEEHVRAHKAPF